MKADAVVRARIPADMNERAIATGENGIECVRFPSIMKETTLNV